MYYKYLPIERLSYLDNELLRFTQPTDLNDPFECLPQRPSKQELLSLIDDLHNTTFVFNFKKQSSKCC